MWISRRGHVAALAAVLCAAGCASAGAGGHPADPAGHPAGPGSSTGTTTTSAAVARGTLTVHIGIFGGPARPDGSMAVSDAPAVGRSVTIVDARGRRTVATTDARGVATARLTAGPYRISAPFCSLGPRSVRVTAARPVRVQFDCPVP